MFCTIHRWRLSQALDAGCAPAAATAAHVAGCPSCRRYAETISALGKRLDRDAAAFAPDAPPFMAPRIMAHVKSGERRPSQALSAAWRPALAFAAAALALAAVVFFPRTERAPRDAGRQEEPPDEVVMASAPIPEYGSAMNRLAGLAQRTAAEQYDAEARKLMSDLKSAANFLAACTPASSVVNGRTP